MKGMFENLYSTLSSREQSKPFTLKALSWGICVQLSVFQHVTWHHITTSPEEKKMTQYIALIVILLWSVISFSKKYLEFSTCWCHSSLHC